MVISDFAIKRPMITIVSMVALVVFGLFALWRLQVDEFPDIQQPVVLTFIPYPGASPEGVEREVLKPVEDAIKGISGVDKIYGTAGDGYAQIITLFLFEKDPQIATQDIRDAISGIREDLPPEMKEPVLQRFDPADQPIVSMTIASPTMSCISCACFVTQVCRSDPRRCSMRSPLSKPSAWSIAAIFAKHCAPCS